MSQTNKIVEYIADCKARDIQLLPPDVNKSFYRFTVEGRKVRFGLEAVKNVGHKLLVQIAEDREKNGEFKNFTNFLERMSGGELNRRALENLIKCGAFDSMGISRRALLSSYDDLLSGITVQKRQNIEGQISLFDDDTLGNQSKSDDIVNLPEYDKKQLLAMEKETIGLYLSGHPLDDYAGVISRFSSVNLFEINELATEDENGEFIIKTDSKWKDGDFVTVGGIITARRNKTTKNNTQMAFLSFEDLYGGIDVIVFPKVYEKFSSVMKEDDIVFIKARISLREDEAPKLMCEQIIPYEDYIAGINETSQTLYLKLETDKEHLWDDVKAVLLKHHGNTCVKVFFEKSNTVRSVSKDLFCALDDSLKADLIRILGETCVKIK